MAKQIENIVIDSKLIDKGFKDLVKELRTVNSSLDATETNFKDTSRVINKVGDDFEDLGGDVSGISDMLKVGLAAAATYAVSQLGNLVTAIKDSAMAGAEFENLYNHFVNLNGGIDEANSKLELLRKATAGNLDDKQLIEFTNEMNSLGFSTEETAKMLDIAEVMGDNLGKTFEQSTEAFKTFIITGQGRSLKEIGINIKEVEAEMLKYAKATQEEIDSLSELEQQQLRSSFVLDTYGRSVDEINAKLKGTDDKLASLETLTRNVSNLIGVALANAFETATNESNLFNTEIGQTVQDAQKLGVQIGNTYKDLIQLEQGFRVVADYASLGFVPALRALYTALQDLTNQALDFLGVAKQTAELEAQINDVTNRIFQNNPNAIGEGGMLPSKEEFERNKKKAFDFKNTGSNNSGTKQATTDVKELTTATEALEKQIADTLKLLEKTKPGTTEFQIYTDDIKKFRDELRFLRSEVFNFTGKFPDLELLASLVGQLKGNEFDFSKKTPGLASLKSKVDKIEDDEEMPDFKTVFADVESVGGSISSIMRVLDDGTNKFINDLLTGFSQVVEVIKALQQINSILSIIPGFASGGTFSGGSPIMVGERGAELIFPRQGGTVVNNSDTTRLLNRLAGSAMQQSPNIYINANMDGLTFLRKNFPNYQDFKKGNRIS